MKNEPEINHERCSELLGDFERGSLPEREAALVARHLEACAPCRQEHAALRALLAVEVEPLTDAERARLHGAIELERELSPARPVLPAGRSRWQRLAPGLGAAALVAALIAGAVLVGSNVDLGGGADQSATGGGGDKDITNELAPEDEGGRRALREGAGAAPSADAFAAPVFDADAGKLTEEGLHRLGARGNLIVATAQNFTLADVPARRSDALSELVVQAPEATADEVRECAHQVLDGAEDALVVYGALGRLEGDPVLVLGFVAPERGSGPLTRFIIWAWPRGSCDFPTLTQSGHIKT